MSEFDILPYRASGGGHCQINTSSVEGTATFLKGEPVEVDADGDLIECTTEPSVNGLNSADGTPLEIGDRIIGFALAGAASTAEFASDGLQTTAETENVQLPYAEIHRGDQFIVPAARFTAADSDTMDGTVAAANVGDMCSLRVTGGVWGVCVHTTSLNRDFRIIELLDANGEIAARSGGAITQIIIRCEV